MVRSYRGASPQNARRPLKIRQRNSGPRRGVAEGAVDGSVTVEFGRGGRAPHGIVTALTLDGTRAVGLVSNPSDAVATTGEDIIGRHVDISDRGDARVR